MTNMKARYLLFTVWIFSSAMSGAQNRNQSVRELNQVVSLMNAFSRCDQDWYLDALQLQKAVNRSSHGLSESYFYCSKTQHNGLLSYSGMEAVFRFPEITPNAQKQIPAYQSDYIPWLEAREKVRQTLSKPKSLYAAFSGILEHYLHTTDSLFAAHSDLNDYVSEKKFRSDEQFTKARQILKRHSRWSEACYHASNRLDSVLVNYSNEHFPPFRTHLELQQGLQELNMTMNLLTIWEKELYGGNLSNNFNYDAQLRTLNRQGLRNDSLYLYKTRGYGQLNSGFWLHTRYRTFYTSMQSRLYWFATATYSSEPGVKKSQQAYNEFVRGYNAVVADYNEYIEIADGLKLRELAACCLGPKEIDTNQNVLLMAPKLLYKFEYEEEITGSETTLPTDSVAEPLSAEALLIRNAEPHHLIYLLDASSSMNESGKWTHLKEQTNNLVNLQRESDRISMITFSGKAEILLRAVPCNQKKHIRETIDRIRAFGQTNLNKGLESVQSLIESDQPEQGVNSVLLLTDGEFVAGDQTKAVLKNLQAKGIRIYLVYLGKPMSKKLRKASEKTYAGMGVLFYDTNQLDLGKALLQIATE